jgi:hypothetical protein
MTRVYYMAHPVSGDVPGNVARALRWLRYLVDQHPYWAISAPWIPYVLGLTEETDRARGLRDDVEMVKRCDGIILVGGRLSQGMALELGFARARRLHELNLLHLGAEPPAAAVSALARGAK